jgi:hypothetical protein
VPSPSPGPGPSPGSRRSPGPGPSPVSVPILPVRPSLVPARIPLTRANPAANLPRHPSSRSPHCRILRGEDRYRASRRRRRVAAVRLRFPARAASASPGAAAWRRCCRRDWNSTPFRSIRRRPPCRQLVRAGRRAGRTDRRPRRKSAGSQQETGSRSFRSNRTKGCRNSTGTRMAASSASMPN